jgi:hypothetical protein
VNTIVAAREVADKYPQSTEQKSQGAGS